MVAIKVIVHELSNELEFIEIHLISDVHLGAINCNEKLFKKYINTIAEIPNAYVILLGDLINNAIKSSVSDTYEELYPPAIQKEKIVEILSPIKDKILTIVSGNHEHRTKKEVNIDISKSIAYELGIPHLYQPYISFLKLRFGQQSNPNKKIAYMLGAAHGSGGGLPGSSLNKKNRFSHAIEGLDAFVTGHDHQPMAYNSAKLVVDPYNNKISERQCTIVSATSWLNYESYAAQFLLNPTLIKPNKIILYSKRKQIDTLL